MKILNREAIEKPGQVLQYSIQCCQLLLGRSSCECAIMQDLTPFRADPFPWTPFRVRVTPFRVTPFRA